jgi:hypothetical protein
MNDKKLLLLTAILQTVVAIIFVFVLIDAYKLRKLYL